MLMLLKRGNEMSTGGDGSPDGSVSPTKIRQKTGGSRVVPEERSQEKRAEKDVGSNR